MDLTTAAYAQALMRSRPRVVLTETLNPSIYVLITSYVTRVAYSPID
jgi:hypothetical protein